MHAKPRGCGLKILNLLLAASLIVFFQATSLVSAELINWSGTTNAIENPQYHAELLQKAFVAAAEKVKPSVVRISATVRSAKADKEGGGPLSVKAPSRGSGSGFFIDRQGHIITSNHVVDPGVNIDVYTADLKRYKARVVGRDVKTDLAIIKVDNSDPNGLVAPVKFGDSDLVKPGQWSLAVGAPYGLEQSVSSGIISGVGRSHMGVAAFENYIQTDAAINPGNSGGPLVNTGGEVIGVIAARLGKNGIGFAIPMNMARQVAYQLIKDGKLVRGYLGVKIQGLDFEMSQKFGLESPYGALVADIKSGGPADKGGLKRGDVIVEFNGASVKDAKDLQLKAAFSPPGTVATLKIIRDTKLLTLSVKMGELEEEAVEPVAEKSTSSYGIMARPMSLKEVDFEDNNDRALMVSSVERGSRAELDGLKSGDIILEIERKRVDCMKDFTSAMEKIKNGQNLLALVLRDGSTFFTILSSP